MTFQGRFADSLVVEQLDKISLSFLAHDLEIRRGGIAANIAFGMANLGLRPVLVGAVAYGALTRSGRLRHPVWQGWRPDLTPDVVGVELAGALKTFLLFRFEESEHRAIYLQMFRYEPFGKETS